VRALRQSHHCMVVRLMPIQILLYGFWQEVVLLVLDGDYFPIADDGTVRGYIWSEYVEDVVPLVEFEQVIESRCIVSTTDISIQDIRIELFPQPACDYLNIKIESGLDFKISLHDIQGKELSQVTGSQLDTSHLSPGVYLLSFEYAGKRQIKKFVKM